MPEDAFAWRHRQYETRVQNRANLRAAATPAVSPEAAPIPTRSFGFQSGAGAPKEEVGRAASLVQAGTELGAPTSFNAGAGAPAPVEVVRGMRTTYTNPAPAGEGGGYNPSLSRNTREFASPVQAAQAFNRGEQNQDLALAARTPGVTPNVAALTGKYGGYVPPKGPEIEAQGEQERLNIAAQIEKRPDLVALGEERKAEAATKVGETNVAALKNYLLSAHGGVENNQLAFKPVDEGMVRDAKAAEEVARRAGVDGRSAGVTHFQERQAIRSYLGTPEVSANLPKNFDANAYMGAVSQNPAAWKELVTRGRALKVTAPGTREPGAMEQLGILGEAATPEWMKPRKGINY